MPCIKREGLTSLVQILAESDPKMAAVKVDSLVEDRFVRELESSGFIKSIYRANRLTAITKEMGQIMLLTSRSPIFSESRDFVTAIFDDAGAAGCPDFLHSRAARRDPFRQKAICRN